MILLCRFLTAFITIAVCHNTSTAQLIDQTWVDANIHINEIQTIGSHNSYKKAIDPSLMAILTQADSATARSLDYAHASLTRQLNLGIRKFEIDVYHDPVGGHYATPYGIRLVAEQGLPPGPPYDPNKEMLKPGFKVFHVQDIDFRSTCLTFNACLEEVKKWSDAHPKHIPIVMMIEPKYGTINREHFVRPIDFTPAAIDSLDNAILNIIPRPRIITPDDVRGKYATLEQAILAKSWPTLGQTRGKFLFLYGVKGAKLDMYVDGHPSLSGRVMFANVEPGHPEAAFHLVNNPKTNNKRIQNLVQKGYMIRTRSDTGTKEARSGDTSRLEAALNSGAQIISTDYYLEDKRFGSGYKVKIPGNTVARFNPILRPNLKMPKLIENLE
ncbi:MAG: hypothetical protein ACI8V2_005442 [Candidatus Latescibacterota bacterium]|jgi:hypothetical protein